MFGWGGAGWEGIVESQKTSNPPSKRWEEEQRINREGRGICQFCKEEIVKNDNMPGGGWTWESEFMLGWCDDAKDRKHKPQIIVPEEVEEPKVYLDPTNELEGQRD